MPPRPSTAGILNDTTVIIEAKLTGSASINPHSQVKGISDESIYQIKDSGSVVLLRTDMIWNCKKAFGLQIDVISSLQSFINATVSIQAVIDDPTLSQRNALWYRQTFVLSTQRERVREY